MTPQKSHNGGCAPSARWGQPALGFTLIELMITVAIVAVLGALAYPAFTEQVARGKRAEAKIALNRLALWMERNRTESGSYLTMPDGTTLVTTATVKALNMGLTEVRDGSGTLTHTLTITPGTAGNGYEIRVIAQSALAARDSACATLSLDHLGRKGRVVAGATSPTYDTQANTCWTK